MSSQDDPLKAPAKRRRKSFRGGNVGTGQAETVEERFAGYKRRCKALILYMTTSMYETGMCDSEKRLLRHNSKCHFYDEENKELFFVSDSGEKKKCIWEQSETYPIIKQAHVNPMSPVHGGVNATTAKITPMYTWPRMKEDVKNFVANCEVCQHCEKRGKVRIHLAPITTMAPLELVTADIVGPLTKTVNQNSFIVMFVDHFTKFVDFFAIKEKSAQTVSRCVKSYICRWGIPCQFLLEQPHAFVNQVNAAISRILTVGTVRLQVSNHPLIKELHRSHKLTMRTRLGEMMNATKDNWDYYLEDVAFSMRMRPDDETQSSPYSLMFGRHPRLSVQTIEEQEAVTNQSLPDVELPDLLPDFVENKQCGNDILYEQVRQYREQEREKKSERDQSKKKLKEEQRQEAAQTIMRIQEQPDHEYVMATVNPQDFAEVTDAGNVITTEQQLHQLQAAQELIMATATSVVGTQSQDFTSIQTLQASGQVTGDGQAQSLYLIEVPEVEMKCQTIDMEVK